MSCLGVDKRARERTSMRNLIVASIVSLDGYYVPDLGSGGKRGLRIGDGG
jgi:hypothetical protein